MRIISGEYRGHHFSIRKKFPSRPTTDFAKENIFNVIGNYFNFNGLDVLDLFAGTGSISYEFASRGARVDLIENDYKSIVFIKKNIESLKSNVITPYMGDVFKKIKKLNKTYDIVFADPPYTLKRTPEIPELIFEYKLLKKGGWLILEHSKNYTFNAYAYFKELRKYGSVYFSIFENEYIESGK
ncbi:Ribosomal RNA small subunit methyltransferase D [subsurface metagenome]